MNTRRTTRLLGLLTAVVMTIVTNGSMLWQFDKVAQEGALSHSGVAPALLTLDSVTVVAQRS
jgi:hypothetical protein